MSAHLDIYDVVHDHPQAKQELENYDNVVVAALAVVAWQQGADPTDDGHSLWPCLADG